MQLGPRLIQLCLIGVLAAASQTAPARAQLFWDWGGGNEVGASGREIVRFNAPFGPGHIVVSFGDRRLYFVQAPGEAISYRGSRSGRDGSQRDCRRRSAP
jgi:hypothetical protein